MVYITSNSVYSGMYTSLRGLVGQYGNGYTLLYLTKTPTQVSCTFIVWMSDMPELRSTVNSAKQMQHSFLIVHCSEHAAFPQFVFFPSPSLVPMHAGSLPKLSDLVFEVPGEPRNRFIPSVHNTHLLERRKIQLRCYTSYWLDKFLQWLDM